ncbi:hypothetical protein DMC47_34175 [Nostoc sp. 3335mG]|nr:hypothetical protein DMC47_34175 [Nostoc sp. 3335mG]
MRAAALAIALIASAPAIASDLPSAATPVSAHAGDMLRDANNVRLSEVDSVNKDGSVGIIYNGHVVTIPAASLGSTNGKLVTSLTKAQIGAM